MDREFVGCVTEEEKEQLIVLQERSLALDELMMTLNSPWLGEEEKNNLYEKIILDKGVVVRKLSECWQTMSRKYKWKGNSQSKWSIDFSTNNIYLEPI